jgi:hypothetical protein
MRASSAVSSTFGTKAFVSAPVAGELRPFIDAAIHAVLEEAARKAALRGGVAFRCADYALLGSRVLGKLTKHPYTPVAGKALIDCGAGRFLLFSAPRKARRQTSTLSEVLGYHCWIESLYPVAGGDSRLEIIDFTIRHDAAAALASKVPFSRRDDKPFLWDWSDVIKPPPQDLCRNMGAGKRAAGWLWKDAASTRLLHKYEREYDATFERLAWLAIIQFCDIMQGKVPVARQLDRQDGGGRAEPSAQHDNVLEGRRE